MGTLKYGTHLEHLWAVAGSRSGRLVAIAGERDAESIDHSRVHVYSKSKLESLAAFEVKGAIAALDFAADDVLIAGGSRGELHLFDVSGETGKALGSSAHALGVAITAIASDDAGTRVAVVDDSGHLAIYALADGKLSEQHRERISARPLRTAAFDVASGKLAVGGDDNVVRVLGFDGDGKPQGETREMPTGEKGITALTFTGDGRVIAGCGDGSIRVSYLEGAADEEDRSGDQAHVGPVVGLVLGLQLHDEAGRELTRRLLSVGRDGKLKAWIHDTRRQPKTVEIGTNLELRAMAWLRPYRAKDDAKGGTLLIIDGKRRLHLVRLDAQSSPNEDIDRIASHFAKLGEDLKARKDELREQAVNELANLPEDSARTLLDRVIGNDRKPEIRKRACEAVAEGMRRRSRPALRTALNDGELIVRMAAFAALRKIEGERALAPVRAALGSKHADVRKHAVSELPGLRGSSPLVPGLVAERLRDSDHTVRSAALEAVCALEPKGSRVPLRTAYEQGPPDIRIAALRKLYVLIKGEVPAEGALADPTGRDLFEDALDDKDGEVRETAFLLSVGTKPRLLARIGDTFKAEIGKLAKLGTTLSPAGGALVEADLEPLFAAMACREADTALRGAKSLAVIGDARSVGALLQLSREANDGIRRQVVDALFVGILAMPDDDRLAARLQWLLDDPNANVRAGVFENLQLLASDRGDAGALDLAELALGAASEDMRVRALQVLVEFGGTGKRTSDEALGRRADELLGDALDDEAQKVRKEAFRTLWAWHSKQPQTPLTRGAGSRHADIREDVVKELDRVSDSWADELLLGLVPDQSVAVGTAAFEALVKSKSNKDRVARYKDRAEVYLAAMSSPRPQVRAQGAEGARKADKDLVRKRLIELLDDEHVVVHTAAIESLDRLLPKDQHAWNQAFGSKFWGLRVRAAELCGKRRDDRAIAPMRALLTIPASDPNRPGAELRQRGARAMADVGDRGSISFFVELLDDADAIVREMASRGLATACEQRDTQTLLAALSHGDLPVRSWIAEGLAQLGDVRAVPVLVGTLAHEHRPIRVGAILSLAALGPDGSRGLLRGLEDRDREVQDLVFAIVVARDVARVRAKLGPDLMLAALASSQPEIRYVAARALEERQDAEALTNFAAELVGPPKPDKAADMKKWPDEAERGARVRVVVDSLASDDPALRYAAARVLSLRSQALAFWREAGRLRGPKAEGEAVIPQTNWEDGEARQPRRSGWIRRLIGTAVELTKSVKPEMRPATDGNVTPLRPRGDGESAAPDLAEIHRLVFGTYAGLVRQAPAPGAADETHRVRRDSIDRLGKLGEHQEVGRDAVLPVLRRALSDPHHLVRRAAVTALRGLYPAGAVEPLGLALQSSAADVGRGAMDELIALAQTGTDGARAMALEGVDAPNAEVRAHALLQIQKLFDAESLEPWFVALGSSHADLRLSVVDRLVDARDDRVGEALMRAMESDHEDLRLKAASALARRGDLRTVDVLAGFLRAEDQRVATRAVEALVSLAKVRRPVEGGEPGQTEPIAEASAAAAECIAARLEDDPDRTADRNALIGALQRIADAKAAPVLLGFVAGDDAGLRSRAYDALLAIALDTTRAPQRLDDGTMRTRYHESLLLPWLPPIIAGNDPALREKVGRLLRDVDDADAEGLLARLIEDREEAVRVAACETLAFRAEWVPGATLDALEHTLAAGRRELVLPAAEGLAARGKREAFKALLLVFKAGADHERRRAIAALGVLADSRALEDLEVLLDPEAELTDEDRALAPAAVEALGAMLPKLDELGLTDDRDRVRQTVERAATQGSQNLRLGAIAGLAKAGDGRSRALIEQLARERLEPEPIRVKAVAQLGALGDQGSEEILAALLSDNSAGVRSNAQSALERLFPTERTRTALLGLRSQFTEISGPAASFLAKHGDAEVLVARMTEIADDSVRQRLRRGLIRRGQCPRSLAELLRGSAAAQRADAAWIAGASGASAKDELGDALASAVAGSAKQWRELAGQSGQGDAARAWRASLWAARRLGVNVAADARAVVNGSAAGSGEVPAEVLGEALRWLGQHGSKDALADIEPALSHRIASVRTAAGEAVAKLAGDAAGEVVDRLTVADQVAVAPIIAAAMRGGQGQDLLETAERRRLSLPLMLGDARFATLTGVAEAAGKDPARLTAIAALGRLGTAQATAVLQGLLDRDGEPEPVRKAAFKALRRAQRGKTTTANRANRGAVQS